MNNNIVITGANRGIGLALVETFKKQGDNVYALCRTASPKLTSVDVNVITGVDVSTEQGINRMEVALNQVSIDVLVCNAGILRNEHLSQLNIDTIREQFEVNALAPLRVVNCLLNNMNKNSKVAMITSRMGSMADNSSGGYYGYRMSKAALNAAAVSLTHDVSQHGISLGIYHPGYVQTDMVNHGGDISADLAAQRITHLINELSLSDSGKFKHANGDILPW
jgi:NAD(P)-dependent dehydrogenase (short-subunit alcohol dehydrogenase family)